MQHVRQTIEQLRRYIQSSSKREDLEEVDVLLSVALDELRRKRVIEERLERGQRSPDN
ncbi:hypothetical protein [Mesorhizobium sp. CAU 1741]|uniref:hypothetical protein n=1 Tax=Mesorhizobium sp. CAU 1741 TaxID=3140366 RepID=UPI00325A89CF